MTTQLSFSQKLDFIPATIAIGLTLLYKLVSAPFRGTDGALTYKQEVFNAVVRRLTNRLSVGQLQYVRGTSTGAFNSWAAEQSTEVFSENIKEGGKLHWIGNRNSSKVMLHIHGGGYVLPLAIGHLNLLSHFHQRVKSTTGIDIAVAILEYTLAPHAPYPTQFRQANAALHHILKSHTPANVIVSGDSAGAHIVLCVISHMLSPHPMVEPAPVLLAPLAGLLMISPRVTNATTAKSFSENGHRDIMNKESLTKWIANFRANSILEEEGGIAKDGVWTEPLNASDEWWRDINTKVTRRVFISAGSHECFRDDIVSFAESWKRCDGLDVTFIVEHKGIHDSPQVDMQLGKSPSALTLTAGDWLASTLKV